jgi:hypothetical protein
VIKKIKKMGAKRQLVFEFFFNRSFYETCILLKMIHYALRGDGSMYDPRLQGWMSLMPLHVSIVTILFF